MPDVNTFSGWIPATTQLGSYFEMDTFLHGIDYAYSDAMTGETAFYKVTVTADQPNPESVTIVDNKISGYFKDSFLNKEINYFTTDEEYKKVKTFRQIEKPKLKEMVYYHPDGSLSQTFTYTAVAKDALNVVIATNTYSIVVRNNWTAGELALVGMVAATKDADKSKPMVYFKDVTFTTKTGTGVSWGNNL